MVAGDWLICRYDDRTPIVVVTFHEDGQVTGASHNEVAWRLAENSLTLYRNDGAPSFIFGLERGRGGLLNGQYVLEGHEAQGTLYVLRPLGKKIKPVYGPLPTSTTSPEEALELARTRTDFTYIMSERATVRSAIDRLFIDGCKLQAPEAVEFFRQSYDVDAQFIHFLNDAQLVSGLIAITKDGKVIGESACYLNTKLHLMDYAMVADHSHVWIPEQVGSVSRQAGSSFLYNTLGENYGHWHLQTLTNAADVLHIEDLLQERMSLLCLRGLDAENFREKSTSKVGLDPKRVVTTSSAGDMPKHECYDRLLVPSTLHIPQGLRFHPRFMESLKDLRHKREIPTKRLYLSRDDAGERRTVLNGDELFNALSSLGFIKITPSSMGYEQELQIFSEAEIVVSPHGGALTNMIGSEPGLKIIELFHSAQLNSWYKNLAALCGHAYMAYCVDPPQSELSKGWNAHFSVNVDRVMEMVRHFLPDAR